MKGNAIYAREEGNQHHITLYQLITDSLHTHSVADGATRYFVDKVPSATSLTELKVKPDPSLDARSQQAQQAQFSTQDTVTQSYSPVPTPPVQVSGARRSHAYSVTSSPYTGSAQVSVVTQDLAQGTSGGYSYSMPAQNVHHVHAQMAQANIPQAHAHAHAHAHMLQPSPQAHLAQHTPAYQQPPHTQPQTFTQSFQPQHLAPSPHAHTVVSNPNQGSYVISSPAGFSGPPTQRRPDPTDLPDLPKYLAAKADLSAIMRDFTDNKIHFVGVDNHVIAMAEYQNISKFTKSGEDPAKFMKGEYRSYKTGYVKKTNSYTENKLFFPVFHPYAPQHISGL